MNDSNDISLKCLLLINNAMYKVLLQ